MPKPRVLSTPSLPKGPNYSELVQFLIKPLLESPTDLSVDCEQANERKRVWIRLAFEETDKGRVYGRGGRNFQAIRAVLETTAATVGQTLYLDIYDSDPVNGETSSFRRPSSYGETGESGRLTRRRPRSRPVVDPNHSA
jgi:predicted RNA-binding protein YlqC (UPF0109 family)